MNVNRTHNSSGTYFQIKQSGICQKCFCNKISKESGICCKLYSSKEIPLSLNLKKILFGNNKDNNYLSNKNNFNFGNNKLNTIKNCKELLNKLESEINLRK
jgi:hypothetical protein